MQHGARRHFPAPIRTPGLTVLPEWIDYNGHMNVAYYVLLFDRCVDDTFEALGMGPAYVASRHASFFTAELHVSYLRELAVGTTVEATFQLLAHDAKRIRGYLELVHAGEGFVAASADQLFLHVDMAARRVAPFPDDILANLAAMRAAHAALPRPERTGRAITLGD